MGLVLIATCSALPTARAADEDDRLERRFWADATTYSVVADQELSTYRSLGGGGVGPGGTLTEGVADRRRHFKATIVAKLKSNRFLVNVTVQPDEGDPTLPQSIDYDLTDLQPRLLEITRDEERIYRLALVPKVIERPKPVQFNASDLHWEYWSFPSSPVIVNDQDYIGRLAMSSGPIAFCDIPGLARIEFSLLHLKDAEPIGSIEDGVINITHPGGTTLRISDVKNGSAREELPGGPYRVWVRWSKPSQTIEQYRESMKRQVASLRERVKNGEATLSEASLKRLEQMSEAGRIGLSENGIRPVEPDDLAEPEN